MHFSFKYCENSQEKNFLIFQIKCLFQFSVRILFTIIGQFDVGCSQHFWLATLKEKERGLRLQFSLAPVAIGTPEKVMAIKIMIEHALQWNRRH